MLTERQTEVLEFISDYITINGFAPSNQDIASAFGFSVNAAADHLGALEKKGAIKRTPRVSRSIVLIEGKKNV